jgi:hypothetical protein
MSREELIAYLELKAHAFEGHPVHSDLSEALRLAKADVSMMDYIHTGGRLGLYLKPSLPWNGQLPHVPDDT